MFRFRHKRYDNLEHVLNVSQWKSAQFDGEDHWTALARETSVGNERMAYRYVCYRVEPTDWVAPLHDGKPIIVDGYVLYERVKR